MDCGLRRSFRCCHQVTARCKQLIIDIFLQGSEQLLSTWRFMHRLRSHKSTSRRILGSLEFFFRAGPAGSLASRYYGMLHIAPDIGDAVCPGETPDIGGCLCTYMNSLYSISWSISKFLTSMYDIARIWILWLQYRTLHRRKSFGIGGQRASDRSLLRISYPISKFLISILKSWPSKSKSWLRYRMWQRALDWSLLPISYPISKFFTSILNSWLRYRSHDFDIEVFEYPISWNLRNMTSIPKSKTSISKSKLCFWYWINPYHAEGRD
jgi:hypothetical protein